MTADDLPPDVKRQLLAQVRGQLGDYEFVQLVGTIGEDGVVNAVLAQMARPAAAPRTPGRVRQWVSAAGWLGFLVVGCVFLGIACGGEVNPKNWDWRWKVGLGVAGCVGEVIVLRDLTRKDPAPAPSGPRPGVWAVIESVVTNWPLIVVGVGGFVLGPVLLVWGLIDLGR